jgi:predicted dehydrogenase
VSEPIRIALVGAGSFGRKHIEVLAAVPGFALAGIADPSPAARALAEAQGVEWAAEAGALLDAVRPDGAIVVTPNHLHVAHGILCIARGVPVLVEKPVADTPAGGERLAAASDRAGVPVLVGHHRRHNPLLEAARDVVASGRLGRVTAVNLTWLLRKPDSYFEAAWRREPGGGPVLINLVHEIDALRFVVGDIAAVRAMTSDAARGFAVEDTAAIALRFARGALGTVIVSDATESPWAWEMTSGENPIYPQQPAGNGVIAGTAGSLSLPHLDLWRHVAAAEAERGWTAPMQRERVPVAAEDAYHRQLRHFGRVIRREEAPRVSARDAARSLAVCAAVHQSAQSGREVVVEQD